jgi:Tol biopolymer transport system component
LEGSTESVSPYGSLYFRIDDQMHTISAQCIIEASPCPLPTKLNNLTTPGTSLSLDWSPKGDVAAIMTYPNQAANEIGELYLFEPAKNEGHILARGEYESYLSWSPDGAWLAFSSKFSMHNSGYPEANELYVIRADGSELHALTTDLPGVKFSFAWVDSMNLAFTYARGNFEDLTNIQDIYSPESVYTANVNASQLAQIAQISNLSGIGIIGTVPILPDNQIVLRAVPVGDEKGRSKLYILDLTTTDLQEFTDTFPFWSPDGEWMVVIEGDDPLEMQSIVLMRGDGSEPREILPLPPFADSIILWSPDSQSFLLIETGEEQIIWFVPSTGSPRKINDLLGLAEGDEVLGLSWQHPTNP